jgi:hypothetical protein
MDNRQHMGPTTDMKLGTNSHWVGAWTGAGVTAMGSDKKKLHIRVSW